MVNVTDTMTENLLPLPRRNYDEISDKTRLNYGSNWELYFQ